MKRILLLVSVFLMLAFTNNVFVGSTSVVIAPSSKLLIHGKTNVNSFNCKYDVLKLNKPIPVFFKKYDDKIVFEKTTLVLDNSNFDCGGTGINNDFQELLKTGTYPQIFIKLKEICKYPLKEDTVQADVELVIAGITKSYTVPIKLEGEKTMSIKGVLSLNLRDFNLEPPRKALGLIVVKDIIEIDFQLMVKES